MADKTGERVLHIMRHAASSSFYPVDVKFCQRFSFAVNLEIIGTQELQTTTFREALTGVDADFIKLDAEGAEVDILRGADLTSVMGVVSEIRFTDRLQKCPTFADLDKLCTSQGLELYDLDLYRYARKALPYPYLYNFRDQQGRAVPGATTQGQLLTGDAVYFRDATTRRSP